MGGSGVRARWGKYGDDEGSAEKQRYISAVRGDGMTWYLHLT